MNTMRHTKRSEAGVRWGCVLVTLAAAWVVAAYVDLFQLWLALQAIGPGFFMAGMAAYGLLLLASAFRLHLVFQATGVAVDSAASMRSCLAGHFLYFALFGAVGGDTARSALYARRYGFALPRVLATAPLDRLLGFFGFLVFAALSVGVAAVIGGASRPEGISLFWPSIFAGSLVVIAGFTLWGSRQARFAALRAFFDALFDGARTLWHRPGTATLGAMSGLVVQVVLSGLLALNLYAVAPEPLPWARLAWTFPVIAVVASFPVTIGGLGTREGAAIALFGMYGVAPHHAVAASLLSFAMNLGWAVLGGLVLLWELRHRPEGENPEWPLYESGEGARSPDR